MAVYPKCELLDVTPLLRVRDRAPRETRFIADAHLGGLAHLVRMTCFDTLYDNHFGDDESLRQDPQVRPANAARREFERPVSGASSAALHARCGSPAPVHSLDQQTFDRI